MGEMGENPRYYISPKWKTHQNPVVKQQLYIPQSMGFEHGVTPKQLQCTCTKGAPFTPSLNGL